MQPCPRQRDEATLEVQRRHVSHWEPNGTCSYCGSISPEMLFLAIETGCELGPTDKSYKVYVTLPNPKSGRPCVNVSMNFKPDDAADGWIEVTAENIA